MRQSWIVLLFRENRNRINWFPSHSEAGNGEHEHRRTYDLQRRQWLVSWIKVLPPAMSAARSGPINPSNASYSACALAQSSTVVAMIHPLCGSLKRATGSSRNDKS